MNLPRLWTVSSFPLLFSLAALIFLVWIIVPAPLYTLWLVAVVASEWSLWFGALGLLGALLSFACFKRAPRKRGGIAVQLGLVVGLSAAALSLYPPLSAQHVAAQTGTHLSLKQYLFGLSSEISDDSLPTTTFAFATNDGQQLQLDVYSPPAASSSRPAIIIVHGGSWSGGVRSDFPQWNRWLASHGFVVFDIDYRLAPQPNWQTATSDVRCAILWVKAHAQQFEVDAERIALLGRSAGGHLALLAAYTHDNTVFESSCAEPSFAAATTESVEPTDTLNSCVRAVVALYAPTDLRWAYRNPANQRVVDGPETIRRFTGGTPESEADVFNHASPVAHVTPSSPPTLLIHGGQDQLVREQNMELLAEALRAARVPHESILIQYAQHGFDYNFNGWGAQVAQSGMLRFLNAHLAQQ